MNKQLRVAMLGAYPMDATHLNGGVQAAYAYLVKGLADRDDLDLHILLPRPAEPLRAGQLEQKNVQFHWLAPHPRYERLRNYRAYQAIVNQTLAEIQPDLIHAQDAGAEALVAIRSGFPSVVTVHGIRWEDGKHYSSFAGRLRVYYDSLITERYVVSHARYLIAISSYVACYFKGRLRADVKIYNLPNALDERFFALKCGADQKTILFAGRVIPRKRVMDLVQAFGIVAAQIPSVRLRIAGELGSEPAYVESIRRWVVQSHLEEKIAFLGSLSEEAVLREFASCSLLALPSAQETAPMVIAQAMAAGKPVVATPVGGVSAMLGEDSCRGILVGVGEVSHLAKAMSRLLLDPQMGAEMGGAGRKFALDHFHLEGVARRTSAVYQQISIQEKGQNHV